MPNLIDALLSLNGNQELEDNMNSPFLRSRNNWVKEASEGYTKYNTSPNVTISKIASANNLNSEQIQRLVEETNVDIYLNKYATTRGQKVRRVDFELADARKIQPKGECEKTALSTYGGSTMILEKVASESETNIGSTYDAFSDSRETYAPIWGDINKVAATAIKKRIETKISDSAKEKLSAVHSIIEKVANVANALIYNERASAGAQELLEKLASDPEVNYDINVVTAIINKTASMVADMKHFGRLPSNFDVVLTAPIKKKASKNLGIHSMQKQESIEKTAEEYVVSAKSLPDRVSYEKLVALARQLKTEIDANEGSGPVKVRVK